jgi:hypothetical protein
MNLPQVPFTKVKNGLAWLKALNGITYGHDEVAPGTPAAAVKNTDCSETSERFVVDYLELKDFPDYSLNQLAYCRAHGREVDWQNETVQPGDLVFLTPGARAGSKPAPMGSTGGVPGGQPSAPTVATPPVMGHVAIVVGVLTPSQAGGIMLIEARGGKGVIYTPLDMFVAKFGARFAGVWRIVEIVESPTPPLPLPLEPTGRERGGPDGVAPTPV